MSRIKNEHCCVYVLLVCFLTTLICIQTSMANTTVILSNNTIKENNQRTKVGTTNCVEMICGTSYCDAKQTSNCFTKTCFRTDLDGDGNCSLNAKEDNENSNPNRKIDLRKSNTRKKYSVFTSKGKSKCLSNVCATLYCKTNNKLCRIENCYRHLLNKNGHCPFRVATSKQKKTTTTAPGQELKMTEATLDTVKALGNQTSIEDYNKELQNLSEFGENVNGNSTNSIQYRTNKRSNTEDEDILTKDDTKVSVERQTSSKEFIPEKEQKQYRKALKVVFSCKDKVCRYLSCSDQSGNGQCQVCEYGPQNITECYKYDVKE